MNKIGSILVTGKECKYEDICNFRNLLNGCKSHTQKPEDCILYQLITDVREMKND